MGLKLRGVRPDDARFGVWETVMLVDDAIDTDGTPKAAWESYVESGDTSGLAWRGDPLWITYRAPRADEVGAISQICAAVRAETGGDLLMRWQILVRLCVRDKAGTWPVERRAGLELLEERWFASELLREGYADVGERTAWQGAVLWLGRLCDQCALHPEEKKALSQRLRPDGSCPSSAATMGAEAAASTSAPLPSASDSDAPMCTVAEEWCAPSLSAPLRTRATSAPGPS